MERQDYAKEWNTTTPEPGTYKFGEKRRNQLVEFLMKTKFNTEDWEYWISRLSQKPWNKLEQKFISTLIKHRTLVRRYMAMSSLTATIESEGKKILETKTK